MLETCFVYRSAITCVLVQSIVSVVVTNLSSKQGFADAQMPDGFLERISCVCCWVRVVDMHLAVGR
jgi:hypothetical protein